MRRVVVVVVLALVAVLSPTAARADYPGPPEKIKCGDVKLSRNSASKPPAKTVWAIVRYRVCVKNSSVKFRKLLSLAVGYDLDRNSPCNWSEPFEGVEYNPYFWDNLGRNYNPPAFSLGCSEDGTNQRVISLAGAPRLYYAAGSPRWKVNFKVKVSWGVPDPHGVLKGKLS